MDRVDSREQALAVMVHGELRRRGVSDPLLRAASARMPAALANCVYPVFDGVEIHGESTEAGVADLVSRLSGGGRVLCVRELTQRLLS